jgi:DNA-binding SARP family transcriptional activator/tetratricopeptide (TPR) repeat protein
VNPPGGPVRFRLSSTLVVEAGDREWSGRELGSRKARTLLALLAAERGRPVPTDRIVDALWHDTPPSDPAANVATLVSRIRRTLGPSLVVGLPGAYGLGGPWGVDLIDAERWCAEAAARLGAAEHALADSAATAALDLLGGQVALLDEADDDWVLAVRGQVDGLRRSARRHRVAALLHLDPDTAVRVATDGVASDPYDEQAVRDLMRALAADGRVSGALAAYDRLARTLREELGTDPDPATEALHLSLLRAGTGAADPALPVVPDGPVDPVDVAGAPPPVGSLLVGRAEELARVGESWGRAVAGGGTSLVVVVGEGGIGKTRLLDAVAADCAATGGQVLRGRCHPAERSLFLQPFVDALWPVLGGLRHDRVRSVLRDHEAAWVSLVPDLAAVLPPAVRPADRDLQRRATYDAVAAALRRLADARPVLLVVDDLQDAGAATIDLLGYLARQLATARVLLVGAVRSEDPTVLDRLGERATRVPLGPLGGPAVEALAEAAGLPAHGHQVMARTAGHTLSVVECLRALQGGESGVPASLADGVLARVRRLDADGRSVVEAGSVLRRRLDPRLLAGLTEMSEVGVIRHAEDLTRSGLLVRTGEVYEFTNDLFQECVYAALPAPVAAAYHRRAADLTSDRPEVMAVHAHAVGDDARAALGWLVAGEEALRRSAVEDARTLVERCLEMTSTGSDVRARALLVRARVHEAGTSWSAAIHDADSAMALARSSGERRLELAALRARGGDAAVGAQLGADEVSRALEDGQRLAADLGDRRAEADFASRLAVLEASRLRLVDAGARAASALARARAASSPDGAMLALDGLKTVAWYLGDARALADAVAQLEPMLQERPDPWLRQWVVFESAFVPAAADRWEEASGAMADALDLNRRSGFPAYAGWLHAYEAWLARLAGDLDRARTVGRRAVEQTSAVDHPWWHSWAAGLLAATLVETGDRAEAQAVARAGLAARSGTARPGRLLCAAALAELTGERTREATDALGRVDCPPGHAWILGADAYLLLAGAAAARGDEAESDRLLAPLRTATAASWPSIRRRVEELDRGTSGPGTVPQSTSSAIRAARAAPSDGTGR